MSDPHYEQCIFCGGTGLIEGAACIGCDGDGDIEIVDEPVDQLDGYFQSLP